MSPERAPRTSIGKNSIVDVFCKTKDGRKFIVEMQMNWTANFKQRVLFNAAKAYVRQMSSARAPYRVPATWTHSARTAST